MSKNYGILQDKNGNNLFPVGIETVSNDNGIALKFPDGTMICYNSIVKTLTRDYNWMGWQITQAQSIVFPVNFVGNIPIVNVSAYTYDYATMIIYNGNPTLTGLPKFYIGSQDVQEITKEHCIQYIAIGRWK